MDITLTNQSTGRATWTSVHKDGLEMDMSLELYAEFDWDGKTAAVYQVGVTDAAAECMNTMLRALYLNSRRGELEQAIEIEIGSMERERAEFLFDDLGFGAEL